MAFNPVIQCMPVKGDIQPDYQQRWLLVDENGRLLADPVKTAEIELSIRFSYLVFRAAGMLRLDIPMEVLEDDEDAFETVYIDGKPVRAVNEGELATAWFSNFYGKTVHLMKIHPADHGN